MQIQSWESARTKMIPMAMVLLQVSRSSMFCRFLGLHLLQAGWVVGAVAGAATAMGQLRRVGARSNSSWAAAAQFLKFTPSSSWSWCHHWCLGPFCFSEGSAKGQLLIYCFDSTKVHLWDLSAFKWQRSYVGSAKYLLAPKAGLGLTKPNQKYSEWNQTKSDKTNTFHLGEISYQKHFMYSKEAWLWMRLLDRQMGITSIVNFAHLQLLLCWF